MVLETDIFNLEKLSMKLEVVHKVNQITKCKCQIGSEI